MNIMEIVFLYAIPSILTIVLMGCGVIWIIAPPSAKILLKKKLGFYKGKALDMIAYDDRMFQLDVMDVTPEAMLEKNEKRGKSKNFYLAKPVDATGDYRQNIINSNRDLDVLPPYTLDGFPVFISHISKAIATNPRVLTALREANYVTPEGKLRRHAVIPKVQVPDENGNLVETNTLEVDVRLPYDPVDIKKNFPNYWQQSNIDSTKRRNQAIGAEKVKQNNNDLMKYIIVLGIVASVIVGLVGFFTNGGLSGGV